MGELLQATERAPAGRPKKIGTDQVPISGKPTLFEIGISKNESSRAQKLAALPEETFQKVRSGEIPVSNIKQVHPSVTVDGGMAARNDWRISRILARPKPEWI